MSYTLRRLPSNYAVMLVGTGGTGGFLADGLARLLPTKTTLYLVDHDRVEKHNLTRQNFVRADLGRFKAQVLAERLARDYGRKVDFCTKPVEHLAITDRAYLTIGCVDNPQARERLQWAGSNMMGGRYSYQKFDGWYIDAGNSEHSGQVLIGNSLLKECQHCFTPINGVCQKLPLPTIQQPALLVPDMKPALDCAERVVRDEQSPIINRVMADIVLTFVHKLLNGTLSWMGMYVCMEAGTMSAVEATPEAVARITGLTVRQVEYRPRSRA